MPTLSQTVPQHQLKQLNKLRDRLPATSPGTEHVTHFVKLHVPQNLEKKFYSALAKALGAGGWYSKDALQRALIQANQ